MLDTNLSKNVHRLTDRQCSLQGRTGRVLVVDDRESSAHALVALLVSAGLEARFALGGIAAIDLLSYWTPHVVLLDIGMEEHDGFAIASIIRGMHALKDIFIVAVTGFAELELRGRGPMEHFDGYYQKGNDGAVLVELIHQMLR
ncbi:hypothetical protein PPGU19_099700 (plasmid) [Paraburkholderia sp. PGU19]|uniref:response regulator n=1 Tax=Paraburkholderia sp. PGU19 TaxID=2735434 RepID=UPI0015DB4A26|nr:response regulator [Paraburkholderia sp. PGU19]BCG05402.1 hypothetical protein PPGU19_099700 [Paraburkholderia sp. PGU19]